MNPLRHDFIRSCRASQRDPPRNDGLTYLDIGCGGGIFAESAVRLASTAAVTAIDPSSSVLAVAQAHARQDPELVGPRSKLSYLNASIEQLPVPPREQDRADVLTLFEVVEHVERPADFLDLCAQHVKPGGWMVLSTIARTWMAWATTKVFAEDVLRVVPRGTHDWNKYLNEDELRGYFAAKGGWNSPRCMGVVYVPGLGWKEVKGSERIGNYFFGVRRDE
jgi:polyprenyldihydroxybenzoate methyltransferase / 3-demethylubiquinol 3-O-methyltransferase